MLPRLLTGSTVTGSRKMSSSRVRMMSELGRPCEAVGPPDAGVGEVVVAPGGLGLVLGNLSDEPI